MKRNWWANCPEHGKRKFPDGSCHECAMLQPKPIVEVYPRGLCTMCMFGTTNWRECPTCGVHNCRHLATEHETRCAAENSGKGESGASTEKDNANVQAVQAGDGQV